MVPGTWYLKNQMNQNEFSGRLLCLSSRFMESLGTMVSFFSQKVKEKVDLIRELSLQHRAEHHGKHSPAEQSGLQTPESYGLKHGVSQTW